MSSSSSIPPASDLPPPTDRPDVSSSGGICEPSGTLSSGSSSRPTSKAISDATVAARSAELILANFPGAVSEAAFALGRSWRVLCGDESCGGLIKNELFSVVLPSTLPYSVWQSDLEILLRWDGHTDSELARLRGSLPDHCEAVRATCAALRNGPRPIWTRWVLPAVTLAALAFFVVMKHRAPGFEVWRTEYFGNPRLEGVPLYVGSDHVVDRNWEQRAPIPGLTSSNYSVRWESTLKLDQPSDVTFSVTADDGVRVYVGNQRVIDAWHPQSGGLHQVTVHLPGEPAKLRVEYFQIGGSAFCSLKVGINGAPPQLDGGGAIVPLLPNFLPMK